MKNRLLTEEINRINNLMGNKPLLIESKWPWLDDLIRTGKNLDGLAISNKNLKIFLDDHLPDLMSGMLKTNALKGTLSSMLKNLTKVSAEGMEKLVEKKQLREELLDMLLNKDISKNMGDAYEDWVMTIPENIRKTKFGQDDMMLEEYLYSQKKEIVNSFSEMEDGMFDIINSPKGTYNFKDGDELIDRLYKEFPEKMKVLDDIDNESFSKSVRDSFDVEAEPLNYINGKYVGHNTNSKILEEIAKTGNWEKLFKWIISKIWNPLKMKIEIEAVKFIKRWKTNTNKTAILKDILEKNPKPQAVLDGDPIAKATYERTIKYLFKLKYSLGAAQSFAIWFHRLVINSLTAWLGPIIRGIWKWMTKGWDTAAGWGAKNINAVWKRVLVVVGQSFWLIWSWSLALLVRWSRAVLNLLTYPVRQIAEWITGEEVPDIIDFYRNMSQMHGDEDTVETLEKAFSWWELTQEESDQITALTDRYNACMSAFGSLSIETDPDGSESTMMGDMVEETKVDQELLKTLEQAIRLSKTGDVSSPEAISTYEKIKKNIDLIQVYAASSKTTSEGIIGQLKRAVEFCESNQGNYKVSNGGILPADSSATKLQPSYSNDSTAAQTAIKGGKWIEQDGVLVFVPE